MLICTDLAVLFPLVSYKYSFQNLQIHGASWTCHCESDNWLCCFQERQALAIVLFCYFVSTRFMLCLCDIIAPIKRLSTITSSNLLKQALLALFWLIVLGFHGFWDLFVVHRGTFGDGDSWCNERARGQHPVVCCSWLQFTNCDFITALTDEMRFCLACLRQFSSSLNDVDASW